MKKGREVRTLLSAKSYLQFVDNSSERLRDMSTICDFNSPKFPSKSDPKLRPLNLNIGKAIQFLTNIKIEQKRKEGEDPSPETRLSRRISTAQKFALSGHFQPPEVHAKGNMPSEAGSAPNVA